MATLNFIGRVNIAVNLVREQYPDAQLYEAQGLPSKGLAESPGDIDKLQVVFNIPNGGNTNGTVTIQSTGWGEFAAPVYIAEPWLEDFVIDWPVDMDLSEAHNLIQSAGYTKAYGAVTLRYPLHPDSKHPYYIFSFPGKLYVWVDTQTKEVLVRD